MVDPVTYKVFTDNTHLVAVGNTGNVYAWDTVERLNVKAKMWRDLVSDVEFGRKDIITLQDPLNVKGRNLSEFKYLREGVNTLTDEQQRERNAGVNKSALGSAALVLKDNDMAAPPARPQVGKYLHQQPSSTSITKSSSPNGTPKPQPLHTSKAIPYNAAQHTTGQAAASFTSTGLTPHTGGDLALLSDEEYMLKPRRVKKPGYARISTNHGAINLELLPEFAPKAVWNFVQLSKKGYYDGVVFHRNIRNFMLQGGDPTGTGKGGASVWDKNFADEFEGPLSHDARGVVSMANKGKNTNSSQFFITYRPCKHLDRKHTIFARVVGDDGALSAIEQVEVSEAEKRPLVDVRMEEVVVFVDPFEEFLREKGEREKEVVERELVRKMGGREDERVTWTGKRVRGDGKGEAGDEALGVGRYMAGAGAGGGGGATAGPDKGEVLAEWEGGEPVKKKVRGGGFGNFDGW